MCMAEKTIAQTQFQMTLRFESTVLTNRLNGEYRYCEM